MGVLEFFALRYSWNLSAGPLSWGRVGGGRRSDGTDVLCSFMTSAHGA